MIKLAYYHDDNAWVNGRGHKPRVGNAAEVGECGRGGGWLQIVVSRKMQRRWACLLSEDHVSPQHLPKTVYHISIRLSM